MREPSGRSLCPPTRTNARLRNLKRASRRRGNKHRRHALKQQLAANPEGAAEVDPDAALGRHRSDSLNGLDRDATRKRDASVGTRDAREEEP